jgi:hypothetical protein
MGLTRNPVSIDFLRIEVETVSVFARIASQAEDEEKRLRNIRNARKGYDTLVYFMSQLLLTPEERDRFSQEILELRRQLIGLGETF